jgi:hypothetical protein
MVVFDVGILVFLVGLMLGLGLLVRVMPIELINVPHRDYWFAPERRRESAEKLGRQMWWIASATVVFVTGINHLTFLANLGPRPVYLSNTGFVALMVGFLGAIALWIARLYRLFPKPPAAATEKLE